MWYFLLKNIVLGPLLKIMFRPWVRGSEKIPSDGAAILARNH
jgi:1-acyl-sn-glycerol-3-phosphate acyltransferase